MSETTILDRAKDAEKDADDTPWEAPDPSYVMPGRRPFADTGKNGGIYQPEDKGDKPRTR